MRVIRGVLILLLIAIIAGCGDSAKEKNVVKNLTDNMRSFCVGRAMVNLPSDAKYGGGRYSFVRDLEKGTATVDLEVDDKVPFGQIDLEMSVFGRKKELEQSLRQNRSKEKESTLAAFTKLSATAYMVRAFDGDFVNLGDPPFDAYSIELYVIVGSRMVKLKTPAYDRDGPNGYVVAEKQLQDFGTQLIELKGEPQEPGFCAGAILIKGSPWKVEFADDDFSIPTHPDIKLEVKTISSITSGDELLENRKHAGMAIFERLGLGGNITTLHSGTRTVGNFNGYELLLKSKIPEEEGDIFEWEYPGGAQPNLQPTIDVIMRTGERYDASGKPPPSLTDAEARGLWDAIISSIRIRPNSV